MCLITFSYQQHSRYPLIVAANRDENYDRPTRPVQFWDNQASLLAGKDLQAGGTWMGITEQGYWSALTNYRDPSIRRSNPPSRGNLPLQYLGNEQGPIEYLQALKETASQYMGFNLLVGSPDKLGYYSNQQDKVRELTPGVYGLSNSLLDTPWPKVERAKSHLQQLITDNQITEEALFNILLDDSEASDEQLPNTGIPKDIEKKVSPIFIKSDGYGTRCSTVLLVDQHGEVTFTERRFKSGTQRIVDENRYQFSISEPHLSS